MIVLLLCLLFTDYTFSQKQFQRIAVSKDIEVVKITENVFVHVSYSTIENYGRVASNGIILIDKGKAALFDTPMTNELTKELVEWITDSLKCNITMFVPNHWHSDCMGGLEYLHNLGIESYANEMTLKIAGSKKLPVPKHGFKDSTTLYLGTTKIFCEYLGAAHSIDNIVVWIPSEKVLFPGCIAKELNSKNLGNTADGDLKVYPVTVKKILEKYKDAKFVIPGHGNLGGVELLEHTLDLAKRKKSN